MSALYAMRFLGQSDVGAGALYIGKGVIVGMDEGGARYKGNYTESGGRFRANAVLSMPEGGLLVTGQQLPPGQEIPISADWPSNFASGNPQQIIVAGHPVSVTFEKVGDIP